MKEFLIIFATVMICLGITKLIKFIILKLFRKRKEQQCQELEKHE